MADRRKRLVFKLFMVSFLAAGLCKGLTSTDIEESSPRTSIKNAATEASSKQEAMQSTWKRTYKDFRIPKHILKLLQRLSLDRSPYKDHGNVIRGYLPNLNSACMKPIYGFTIKRHQSETMQALYLHFLAPEPSSRFTVDIHIHLLPNKSSACQLVGVQHRPIENRGWQVVDLTSQVFDFINTSVSNPSVIMLGISFRLGATERYRGRSIIEKMVSKHARPFLLMFAEEDENSDNNSQLPWTKDGSMYSTRPAVANKRSDGPTYSRYTRSVDSNMPSVMTNEFPSHAHYTTFRDFAKQDSDRRKAKKSKKRQSGSRRHGKALLPDRTNSAQDESEEPLSSQGSNADHNVVLPGAGSQGACARHPMYVEFDALQWDSHIIAPRGFDAFYCAGDCSFPVFKSGKPSNHATIQSAMNVAGVLPQIPPPCCVPHTLSSLSILFFDEEDSLKLKTYQNMVVESCACR